METKPRPCRGFFFPAFPRRGAVFFRSVLLRRLRRGPPRSREALGWSSAPEGAAVLPHWGSSLTSASCLSSRARHIHVPLDPQCGRTASFGAFGAALRSSGCLAWQSADRSDAASTEYGRPRAAQRGRGGGKASRLPGFYKRSHDLHVREGRRALGSPSTGAVSQVAHGCLITHISQPLIRRASTLQLLDLSGSGSWPRTGCSSRQG